MKSLTNSAPSLYIETPRPEATDDARSVDQNRFYVEKSAKLHGARAAGSLFYVSRTDEAFKSQSHDAIEKIRFFVADLVKGGSHKYIRRYKRGGRWMYVYHEPGQHGRAITEEAAGHIKELAELGDEHAKALHESTEDHDEAKLKVLRKLADLGDEDAHHHLKTLGIDRHAEKLEEDLVPSDPIHEKLDEDKHSETMGAVKAALKNTVFDYLSNHSSSSYAQALAGAGVTLNSVLAEVKGDSLNDIMHSLHGALKKIDTAHATLPATQNSSARSVGGYGNLAYNAAVQGMERAGVLPAGYSEEHKRDKDDANFKPLKAKDLAEKAAKRAAEKAREEAKRVEEERRELAEMGDSMAYHMTSMMDGSRGDRVEKTKMLHKAIKEIFGSSLKAEDFPYNFEAQGFKTKIRDMSVRDGRVRLDMQILDANGINIMEGWTRTWSKDSDGRPRISNDLMQVKSSARTGVQIGSLINESQRKLMRSIPGGGTVAVHANIDVGGYNWANQGFSWNGSTSRDNFRYRFQTFMKSKGYDLSDEDLKHFEDPVHFAAFDDGKKYEAKLRDNVKLSAQQIETKSLSGVSGEMTLTARELSDGEAGRMAVHLGKAFMLGTDWYGTWDSAKATDTSKFADKYLELRNHAVSSLSESYRDTTKKVKEGERKYVVSADTRPVTPRASVTSGATPYVQRYISHWAPRGSRANITMNQRRLARIGTWAVADINSFLEHASLTPGGRSQVREIIRRRSSGG